MKAGITSPTGGLSVPIVHIELCSTCSEEYAKGLEARHLQNGLKIAAAVETARKPARR